MNRLSNQTLGEVAAGVTIPSYDRGSLRPGILHLGLGAFHRAHQAVYTDRAIEHSGGDWGIVGVSMRSDRVVRQLGPQDGLYSVLSEDQHGHELRVIGAIQNVLVAPEATESLDTLLSDPTIRVVTLTITEKGYCLGEDGWSLERRLPQVQQDLARPDLASSAIGILCRGLAHRYRNGGAPLTIISCDNLGENSARLRAVVEQYLEAAFPHVIPWLAQAVAFPCSMVDRIVPAVTEEGRQRQSALIGLQDLGAVATEPFSQWIIEDHFAAEVPDWGAAGVQFVDNIRPYEEIKLRLLNASHSVIAISGLLAGKETVADVMADPVLANYIGDLMSAELIPALDAPAGFDLNLYGDKLLQRFANPCLLHRCAQIAMDSTEKIRQRWLTTLQDQRGDSRLLRALACWCYLVLDTDLTIEDPRADALLELRSGKAPATSRLTSALKCLGISSVENGLGEDRLELLAGFVATLARNDLSALVCKLP
jgi:fructuronate reductase